MTPIKSLRLNCALGMLAAASALCAASAVQAADESSTATPPVQTAQAPASAQPAASGWWDTVKFSGHLAGGVTFNPDSPSDGINFGHLFTDRANLPVLNQLMLTVERPLDPKTTGYDFGFKL